MIYGGLVTIGNIITLIFNILKSCSCVIIKNDTQGLIFLIHSLGFGKIIYKKKIVCSTILFISFAISCIT